MSASLLYGVTLTVEAALSASTGTYGVWDTGLWDTATWGPDVIWVDISTYVRQASTSRGFSRDLQAWEAGSATLILNNFDNRFSPSNLSGPYVTSGVTQIRPWRPIRITATYAGISYAVYRGYALAWEETYTLSGDAYVTVPCTDELGRLAGFDGLEQVAVGSGETSGRRIHRILNNAGHTGDRAIDDGRVTMQATTLAANAVTELKLTADSEGGALYVEADGTVTFAHQYALIENTRSNTVQATYGDGGGSELPYSGIQLAYNGDLVANIAAFARANSTAQVAADAPSRALYGDRRATRTDLVCEADAHVAGLAQLWVARYKDPEQRVTSIQITPWGDHAATLFPEILGRRVRDLVRVIRRPTGGDTITRDCHVAGINHTFTPESWATTLELWSATPYTGFSTSLWGTGLWDTATWFY